MGKYSEYRVLDILPQKPPSVYVDRIIDFSYACRKVVAEKYINSNHFLLDGHFPNNPIVPSIFTIEALSQACILCGFFSVSESGVNRFDDNDEFNHLIIKLDIKFRNQAYPGDTLLLEASIIEIIGVVTTFKVKATNKNSNMIIASGMITGIAQIKRESRNPEM